MNTRADRPATPLPGVEWVRQEVCAEVYHVSPQTLKRWADRRWIGRSRIGDTVWLHSGDIADLIAAHSLPRLVAAPVSEPTGEDWEGLELWRAR